MTLNSYFTLNSGYRFGAKYLTCCSYNYRVVIMHGELPSQYTSCRCASGYSVSA